MPMQYKYNLFLKKMAIFQHLTKVGSLLTESKEVVVSNESGDLLHLNDTTTSSPSPQAEMVTSWVGHCLDNTPCADPEGG